MPRHLYFREAPLGDIEDIVPISKGGTNSDNGFDAVTAIGGIHRSRIDKPGGVVRVDEYKNLPSAFYPPEVSNLPTLKGPKSVNHDLEVTYVITNYDSFKPYTLSSNITREGSVIRYKAPSSGSTDSFTVNGRIFNIGLVSPIPPTVINIPTVNDPSSLSTLTPVITSSAFATTPSDTAVLSSVKWEFDTKDTFNSADYITATLTTGNMTSHTPTLSKYGTWYVRVTYNSDGLTPVSSVVRNFILTAVEFKVKDPIITLPNDAVTTTVNKPIVLPLSNTESLTPTLSSTVFATTPVSTTVPTEVKWEIDTVATFNSGNYQTATLNTGSLYSWVPTLTKYDTPYFVRVTYKANGLADAVSEIMAFRTVVQSAPPPPPPPLTIKLDSGGANPKVSIDTNTTGGTTYSWEYSYDGSAWAAYWQHNGSTSITAWTGVWIRLVVTGPTGTKYYSNVLSI